MNHIPGHPTLLPIIMIDDDAEDLELTGEELIRMGIKNEIFTFQLPHEALDFLRVLSRPPYFITCDVHMAKMDAYDLRATMLAEIPRFQKVPFFILTALITAKEMEYAQSLQINGYYTKGFSRESVQQNFRSMIAQIKINP